MGCDRWWSGVKAGVAGWKQRCVNSLSIVFSNYLRVQTIYVHVYVVVLQNIMFKLFRPGMVELREARLQNEARAAAASGMT